MYQVNLKLLVLLGIPLLRFQETISLLMVKFLASREIYENKRFKKNMEAIGT